MGAILWEKAQRESARRSWSTHPHGTGSGIERLIAKYPGCPGLGWRGQGLKAPDFVDAQVDDVFKE
ncbi:hypothetical protein ACMHYJ_10715 [Castellaniella hirudinis]|uniref:hypothetical protein n=1 Tax=Castellaniella hirudinis TaxID=1144617 RepID=UPI0039C0CC65